MTRIVFLGSGGGGNLKFIHHYFANTDIKVVGVLVDRECGALNFAKENKIYSDFFSFNRDISNDKRIIDVLNNLDPDIIVTTINKILSSEIVSLFSGKLINLHYSYLPAFKGTTGLKPVKEAINLNNPFIGVTCHYVTEFVDSGDTISQGIFNKTKFENIFQATFECGALTLLNGIFELLNKNNLNEIIINNYLISPAFEKLNKELCYKIFDKLIK